MPALSFKREWIDALLSGTKTQTTRKPSSPGKPPRFVVGDLVMMYVEQRGKISTKPMYPTTAKGQNEIYQKILKGIYPPSAPGRVRFSDLQSYYAHFLGIVTVSSVSTITPSEMTVEDLEAWAWADGFCDFDDGDRWFVKHYSYDHWDHQKWEVIHWAGWDIRYYDPKVVP